MSEIRDCILDELRSCVKRGLRLPARPDPIDLWNALGGDGYLALMVMLEYESAEAEVKLDLQRARVRDRATLSELAA